MLIAQWEQLMINGFGFEITANISAPVCTLKGLKTTGGWLLWLRIPQLAKLLSTTGRIAVPRELMELRLDQSEHSIYTT